MTDEFNEIEDFFTKNIYLDNVFFNQEVSENAKDFLKLFNVYYNFKNELEFDSFFNSIKNDDSSSYYLMIKTLINDKLTISEKKSNYLKCIELNPKNKWAYLELFYLLQSTELDYEAWGYLEKSIEIDSNFCEAIFQRLLHYSLIENSKVIIEEINSFPDSYKNEIVLNRLAYAYYNNFEYDNAINVLNISLAKKITVDAINLNAVYEHDYLNNYGKALELYNKSLEIDNTQTEILNSKGWVLFDLNKFNESEKCFLELLVIDKSEDSFSSVIQFYLKTSQLRKAEQELKRMIDINGKSFISEALEIVYLTKINDKSNIDKIKSYKGKYSNFENEWIRGILEDFFR